MPGHQTARLVVSLLRDVTSLRGQSFVTRNLGLILSYVDRVKDHTGELAPDRPRGQQKAGDPYGHRPAPTAPPRNTPARLGRLAVRILGQLAFTVEPPRENEALGLHLCEPSLLAPL